MSLLPVLRCIVLTLASITAALTSAAEPLNIVVPTFAYSDRPESRYFYKVVDLAMRKTAAEGPYVITSYPKPMSGQRSVDELKRTGGLVNLIWNITSREREQELLPVRVSLLRELNNYRLLLIRKGEQDRFDRVHSLDDLKRFTAGMAFQWPDADILRANGVTVISSAGHAELFRMLDVKRFDYAPRGLYEIWAEAELPENRNLTIEKSIMLYYNAPFYIFVNKNNVALAQRVERGLQMALQDGSFDELLMSVPSFRRGADELCKSRRRLFVLSSAAGAPPAAPYRNAGRAVRTMPCGLPPV